MTDAPPDLLPDAAVADAQAKIGHLLGALQQVLFGQEVLIERVVLGLLARGHMLLEGLPGLGKTELAKGLGAATGLILKRVQFTPDLLPGDITGSPVLQVVEGERRFEFQKGPVFCQLLLADEINRASPKTQSALLQAMQEGEVTVLGETYALPRPFCVLATQNPIELEGTYPLPEAQLDRFLMKLDIGRSDTSVLERIVQARRPGTLPPQVEAVLTPEEVIELQEAVQRVFLPPVVARYIARLVQGTHPGESKAAAGVRYGASPRAAIALASVARAYALVEGRAHAAFEDVTRLAKPVLQHRILLDYAARLEGTTPQKVVAALLEEIQPSEAELPPVLQALKEERA